jgi:hypothetical protein
MNMFLGIISFITIQIIHENSRTNHVETIHNADRTYIHTSREIKTMYVETDKYSQQCEVSFYKQSSRF